MNYRISRDKYKPDYFLYENNKSMSPAIRAQITKELGVEPVLINSALVSAQNRQRLYWAGRKNEDGTYSQVTIEQPTDCGFLLRDILESGVCWREKGYTLKANYANAGAVNGVCGQHFPAPMAAESVRIGEIENTAKETAFDTSKQYKVYSSDGKATALCGNGGGAGAKTGLYAVPFPAAGRIVGRRINEQGHRDDYNETIRHFQYFEVNDNPQKTNCLTTVQKDNVIAVPVRAGDMPNAEGVIRGGQAHRVYDSGGKAVTLTARPNGGGVDGPLYAVPAGMAWRGREEGSNFEMRDDQKSNAVAATGHQSRLVITDAVIFNNPHGFNKGGIKYEKAPTLTANGDWQHNNYVIEAADGKTYPVYVVTSGQITIKGKQYPIKLADGLYIIRKLTVTECKRLQTVPDAYVFPVSDTQAYKMLGNGWTVDVIAHILSHFDGLTAEPVEVLSMYDGMSCGHVALDKLGVEIATYYATEIDKYAIQTTQHNFPDTVQLGDAFKVRNDDWALPDVTTDLSDIPEEDKRTITENGAKLAE